MSAINPWKPETDIVLHQALGKLAEECSELAKIATRCMIQGYAEDDPVTHKLNRTQLMEEVADVCATMRWLFDVLDIPFKGESPREARKFDGYKRWEAMLRAAPHNQRCQNCDGYNCDDGCAYPEPPLDIDQLKIQLQKLISENPEKTRLASSREDLRMWFVAQLTGIASGRVPLTEIEAIVSQHLSPTPREEPSV